MTSDHDELLRKDYELKISYLTAHLGRMWTRFNFFVTVESGLVAGLVFTRDGGGFTGAAVYFAAAEAVLSAIWWTFGAQDRYLVESYRDAVKQAAERLDGRDTFPRYVGDPARERRYVSLFEWRSDGISITRLAAIVPFVLLVFWVSVAVLLALR